MINAKYKKFRKENLMPAHKKTAPTVRDVAREAGVAVGTVSKVINGKPVREEYEQKVVNAIKKLNYHVNSYAQGLKASRTYTIAVLIPSANHPFFAKLIHHLNIALAKRNYRMLLYCSDYDQKLEQEFVDMAAHNKVDGIIGLTYNPDLVIPEHISFISIDRILRPDIPCISSDNFAGGQLAAEKLWELGCKKVAFFRVGSSLTGETNKRKAGFENGCLIHGLQYEMKIMEDDINDTGVFKEFLKAHIKNHKLDFDGIFCVTDALAVSICDILKDLGFKVPEDIQVIGFDGIRRLNDAGYVCSTIVQPISDIAEMAVELLLQDSSHIKPPLVCLPVTFAEGPTTKKTS